MALPEKHILSVSRGQQSSESYADTEAGLCRCKKYTYRFSQHMDFDGAEWSICCIFYVNLAICLHFFRKMCLILSKDMDIMIRQRQQAPLFISIRGWNYGIRD